MPTTLLLSLLCTPVLAQDVRALMLGNSYTQANDLDRSVEAALEAGVPAWEDVLVKALTRGGATLADHAAAADGTEGDTAWRQELVSGEDAGTWAWVILQDQSQVPGFPQSQADWQASRDGALILDGLIEAGGAETVFLLTWGRRDGDELNPDRYPDFPTMQAYLLEGYQAYADACAADGTRPWIIPAGLAFWRVYEDLVAQGVTPEQEGTAFFELYQSDGSHPSATGSYLAALTAVAALTGRDGAGMAPPDGLDSELAATLQEAARVTVLNDPLGEIDYPWVFTWDAWLAEAQQLVHPEIAGETQTPLVYLDQAANDVTSLDVGSANASVSEGSGRLWLLEGAALNVQDELVLSHGGEAELLVAGGALSAGRLSMGYYTQGLTRVHITGGSLSAGEVSLGTGQATITIEGGTLALAEGALPSPVQTGGTLSLGDLTYLGGDYTLPAGAALTLTGEQDDDAWLTVDGDVVLEGDLTVAIIPELLEGNGQACLVQADSITLDPAGATLPADTELQLLHSGSSDSLILNWNLPCGDCLDQDTEHLGCDCASGGGAPPALLPLLGALLALVRRRGGFRRRCSHWNGPPRSGRLTGAPLTPSPHLLSITLALPLLTLAPRVWADGGWPSLDTPPAGVADRSQDAAVVIGVQDYEYLLDVPGAVDIAQAWDTWLVSSLGVPRAQAWLLLQEDATPDLMAATVTEAVSAVGPEGHLWLVFIGQASPTCDGRDALLFGSTAGPEAPEYYQGALTMSTVQSLLTLGSPARVILLLDASLSERDRSVDKLSCLTMPVMPPVALVPHEREVLLTAAQPEELAGTLLGADLPAFSWLMLAALRGWGDHDGDGAVTVAEALAFSRQVLRATERRMPQTPELWGEGGDLVLAPAAEPALDLDELLSGVAQTQTRARAERLDRAEQELLASAAQAWQDAQGGGPEAAQAFLDRFGLAMVRAEGQRRYPSIPELALARAALPPPPEEPEDAPSPAGTATRDQLRGEMQLHARRNAWKAVDQAFRDLETLAGEGVRPGPEDLDFGAQAARALGEVEAVHTRLERLAMIAPSPEVFAWLDDLERTYGQVDLRDRSGVALTLTAARPPLAPDQRAVIAWAAEQITASGRYRGGLPAGVYHLGARTFVVIPGDPVLEIVARRAQ
ncbi:MAG: hypothetical protein ABIO70_09955 [Pseudomonadota bacterium]